MTKIAWVENKMKKVIGVSTDFLSDDEIKRAKDFHKSFPEYAETPLRKLDNLAEYLGLGGVYIKDESYRFGLNAFKVLGASYAMAKYIAKCLEVDISELDFATLQSPEIRAKLGEITFVTATDGNHGRAVAWAARQFKLKAVVYMPKGSSQTRLQNIRAEGAEASITDLNYDEAVRLAADNAKKFGWVVIQDTAWEGYEEIPAWIMQGYGTIAAEVLSQLEAHNWQKPTHIFLQAGVGSFAGSIAGCFISQLGEARPKISVVEPDLADCIYRSAIANDGKPRIVTGDMNTIMVGLACGEPNSIGWEILRDYSESFFSCPDEVSAKGMRLLGNPLGNDSKVVSGESGAVAAGLISLLMKDEALLPAREALGLDQNSFVLIISTEGDTDPEKYRRIVWDGEYPVTNNI
jgi:diaminopropionate ammonia-lyase